MKIPDRRISISTLDGEPIIRCFGTPEQIKEISDWMADNGMKMSGMNHASNSTWWGRDFGFFYQPTEEQALLFSMRWIPAGSFRHGPVDPSR
jgi:hypothetical protein